MENEILREVQQGKEVEVLIATIDCRNSSISASLDIKFSEKTAHFIFENVTDLCIENISAPFIIQGFEIIDNKSKGWQNECRYTVRDYENGVIWFHCEDIHASF